MVTRGGEGTVISDNAPGRDILTTVVLLALLLGALVAFTTRYSVADQCSYDRSRQFYQGCYVLDRWTGDLELREAGR